MTDPGLEEEITKIMDGLDTTNPWSVLDHARRIGFERRAEWDPEYQTAWETIVLYYLNSLMHWNINVESEPEQLNNFARGVAWSWQCLFNTMPPMMRLPLENEFARLLGALEIRFNEQGVALPEGI